MFESYFIHDVAITPYKGMSGSARPVYGDPEQKKARIEPSTKLVKNSKGEDVVARGFIMMSAGTRYPPGSLITCEGTEYILISLEPIFGWKETHTEGWLG